MARVLRVVAVVAAVVAVAASVALTFGATAFLGVSLATVAAVASAVSAVASSISAALQKPPDMRGTVNEVMIGANMPVPYAIGRTFVGGMKIYDDSNSVPGISKPNVDRTQIFVGSHAGPIDSFQKFLADYTEITFASHAGGLISGKANGFYGADDGYLWLNTRKGSRPDTALTAYTGRGTFLGWGANHKLSGMAAWSATMEFDEDGKRWASGIPAYGMVAKWVMAYDPRLDSTYPGGSGAHRWDDEATWTWSENPAIHALTYARGRFMGTLDTKVVGAGIPRAAIDVAAFVELANICGANGWTCGGALYEGPGLSRWDNLKRILSTAAAEPAWIGGMLTCRFSAPKVALVTITADDLADGEIEVGAMKSWKDRHNTIVPRYRSEAHRWEYVQADAVVNSTYLTEDGESKTDEVQFDLCQNKDQAAELAAYMLVNRREFGPIRLNCKPWLMGMKPGEAVDLDIPEAGLEGQLAVITGRSVDPSTGVVQLTLESETTAKHAFALGRTGVAPPTPSIVAPEDVDTAVSETDIEARKAQLIGNSWVQNLTFSVATSGAMTISDHVRVYEDREVPVGGATVTAPVGTVAGDIIAVWYDQGTRVGGLPGVDFIYTATRIPGGVGEVPGWSPSFPYRHAVAIGVVPAAATTTGGSGVGTGGGVGGVGGGWGTGFVHYQ